MPCASAEGLRWTLSAALVRGSFTAIAIASQQASSRGGSPLAMTMAAASRCARTVHSPSHQFLILPDNHRDFWSSLVRHSVRTWGFATRLNDITSFDTEVRPIRALSASFSSLPLYFFILLINKALLLEFAPYLQTGSMCSLSGGLGYVAVLFRFLVIQCVADRGVYREFSVLEGGGSKKGVWYLQFY